MRIHGDLKSGVTFKIGVHGKKFFQISTFITDSENIFCKFFNFFQISYEYTHSSCLGTLNKMAIPKF
jgi:hypothetical protein